MNQTCHFIENGKKTDVPCGELYEKVSSILSDVTERCTNDKNCTVDIGYESYVKKSKEQIFKNSYEKIIFHLIPHMILKPNINIMTTYEICAKNSFKTSFPLKDDMVRRDYKLNKCKNSFCIDTEDIYFSAIPCCDDSEEEYYTSDAGILASMKNLQKNRLKLLMSPLRDKMPSYYSKKKNYVSSVMNCDLSVRTGNINLFEKKIEFFNGDKDKPYIQHFYKYGNVLFQDGIARPFFRLYDTDNNITITYKFDNKIYIEKIKSTWYNKE